MFCREQRSLLPKTLRIPDGHALLSQMWEALFEHEKTKFAVAAAAMAAGTYVEPQPPPPMPPMPPMPHPSLPAASLPAARPAPVAVATPFSPSVPQLAKPHEPARNPTAYAEPVSSEAVVRVGRVGEAQAQVTKAVHVQLAARRGEIAAQMHEIAAHRLSTSASASVGSGREISQIRPGDLREISLISQAREVSSAPPQPFAAAAAVPAAAFAQGGEPLGAAPPSATPRQHSAGQQPGQQHAMCSAAGSNPHLRYTFASSPYYRPASPRPSPLVRGLCPYSVPKPNQGTAAGHLLTRWAARRLDLRSTPLGAAMGR